MCEDTEERERERTWILSVKFLETAAILYPFFEILK
jgi:hypothetical protein